MPNFRHSLPRLLMAVGLFAVLLLLARSAQPSEGPGIEWEPGQVTATVGVGGTATLTTTATLRKAVEGGVVEVVPALQPYVTVAPSSLSSAPGSSTTFTLSITAPPEASPRQVEGTIHLRVGRRTISRPLPVTVTIWPSAISARNGMLLAYPPSWNLDERTLQLGGPISVNNFGAHLEGGLRPPGGAEIDATRMPLSSTPINEVIAQELSGATILSMSTQEVDGEVGTRVVYSDEYTAIYTEKGVAVYVAHSGQLYKFFLSYTAADPKEAEFMSTFDTILSTVTFSD